MPAAYVVANARYLGRNLLGAHPRTASALALRRGFGDRLVGPDTDVCIEGFPRSGNSFVLKAFTTWNPDARVAHHLHVPAQIARAVARRLPCLVLVRQPVEAVSSLLVANPALDAGLVLASYTAFHRSVARYRHDVVIARFEDAVARPWQPVAQLNARWGTDFRAEVLDDRQRRAIVESLREWNRVDRQPGGLVPVPSPEKEDAKARVGPLVRRHRLLAAARAAHDALLA